MEWEAQTGIWQCTTSNLEDYWGWNCPVHAGLRGNHRADRLVAKATITGGLCLWRYGVFRSLRQYLRAKSKGHDAIDRPEDRDVGTGSARWSSSERRERAIVSQTYVPKATPKELLRRDGERMSFPERLDTIFNELNFYGWLLGNTEIPVCCAAVNYFWRCWQTSLQWRLSLRLRLLLWRHLGGRAPFLIFFFFFQSMFWI